MTTPAKKHWTEQRTVRLLVLSPSQLEVWDVCRRKWWLKHVRKLEEKTTHSQAFGTVLHGVLERYLLADDLGRDANGNPVELYPPGWTKARNRHNPEQDDGEATPAEANAIQTLVKAAIDSGVLERITERAIEASFQEDLILLPCPTCKGLGSVPCGACSLGLPDGMSVCPNCEAGSLCCPTCQGDGKGDRVQVKGYIDYLFPEGVQDHKSTSRMKYAKSKEALRENIQMNVYARILLLLYEQDGQPAPEKISLRHNVYCKDADDLRVRKTEVFVTPAEVMAFWDKLATATAPAMSQLRRTANSWRDCPDPVSFAAACNAYGGCAYRGICGGQESEENYEQRLAHHKIAGILSSAPTSNTTPATPPYKEQTMGILDTLKNRAASVNAMAGTPNPTPVPQAPVLPPQQPAAPTPTTAPAAGTGGREGVVPWANAACSACKGLGLNTNGAPCRICDVMASRSKGAVSPSTDYEIQTMGSDELYWKHKINGVDGVSPMRLDPSQAVKTETRVEAPVTAPVTAPVAAPVVAAPVQTPAVAPVTAPVVAPVAETAQEAAAKKTRAKKGFTLLINCVVAGGVRPAGTIRLVETFRALQEDLGKAAGKPYHDMDAFHRRDELAKVAEALAETFGTDLVMVDLANATPDLKALCESIRPYAQMEIVGTAL